MMKNKYINPSSGKFPYHIGTEFCKPICHVLCPSCGSVYDYHFPEGDSPDTSPHLLYSRFGNTVYTLPCDYEDNPLFKQEVEILLQYPRVFRFLDPQAHVCPYCEARLGESNIKIQKLGGKVQMLKHGAAEFQSYSDIPPADKIMMMSPIYGALTGKGFPHRLRRRICQTPCTYTCSICGSFYSYNFMGMNPAFDYGFWLLYSRFANLVLEIDSELYDMEPIFKEEVQFLLKNAPDLFRKNPGFGVKTAPDLVCPYCSAPLTDADRSVTAGFAHIYQISVPYDIHTANTNNELGNIFDYPEIQRALKKNRQGRFWKKVKSIFSR